MDGMAVSNCCLWKVVVCVWRTLNRVGLSNFERTLDTLKRPLLMMGELLLMNFLAIRETILRNLWLNQNSNSRLRIDDHGELRLSPVTIPCFRSEHNISRKH